MKILFATTNKGKLAELRNLYEKSNFEILSLTDFENVYEVIEDGLTFEANAKKKAVEFFNHYNIPVFADDSGLEVEQLNGAPGVYSARYAGENASYDDNNTKLLNALLNFDHPHFAKFACCAVFYDGKNYVHSFGELKGKIIDERRGSKGFGFDPIFVPSEFNITLAEIDMETKNRISHRGKAFQLLKDELIKKGIL